jgi:hypothetical protein
VIARLERYSMVSKYADRAVLVVLAATVCAFAMGSSSVSLAVRIGGPLRWLLLLALAACAVPYGLSGIRALPRRFVIALVTLAGVALLSASWSVAPRLSAERAISFAVLTAAVVCIGAGASRTREHAESLFLSLLAATDLVALAGLVVLLVDHPLAVQPAAPTMPARMRGFGQNPNTSSMLFALALPIAEWLVVSATRTWIRVAAGASCVLLYGSIMASGSRGAMLAAAAGTVVFIAVTAGSLRRLVPIELVAIALFAGTFQVAGGRPSVVPPTVVQASRVPVVVPVEGSKGGSKGGSSSKGGGKSAPAGKPAHPIEAPAPSTALVHSRFEVGIKQGLTKPDVTVPFVPRANEIGFPFIYEYKPITAYGSGRVFAWLWAIRQGLETPALGYGFGTESKVFVDRFYLFEGSYTENSFVGMFLQLGLVGVLLLILPFVFVAQAVLRSLSSPNHDSRTIIGATAGVVAGGFIVAFFQSYLYSVGNVATLTFWAAAALAVTTAARVTAARRS